MIAISRSLVVCFSIIITLARGRITGGRVVKSKISFGATPAAAAGRHAGGNNGEDTLLQPDKNKCLVCRRSLASGLKMDTKEECQRACQEAGAFHGAVGVDCVSMCEVSWQDSANQPTARSICTTAGHCQDKRR